MQEYQSNPIRTTDNIHMTKSVSLQSSILCPECLNGLFINSARGTIELTHPSVKIEFSKDMHIVCSRANTHILRKDNGVFSLGENDGGIAVIQIPTKTCKDCRRLLHWSVLPDKLRVVFAHVIGVQGFQYKASNGGSFPSSGSFRPIPTESEPDCTYNLILPVATFTVFI